MQPAYGEAQSRLAILAGEWVGGGTVFANPWGPGGESTGSWHFRFDPARLNLIHDFHEARQGGFRFDGHGVLTIDPDDGDCLWFWFDTYGYPPLSPARGKWQTTTLQLEKQTPRGIGRSSFTVSGDRLVYGVWTKLPGAADFAPVSLGEYRRTG